MVANNTKLFRKIVTKVEIRSDDGEIIPAGSQGFVVEVLSSKHTPRFEEYIAEFPLEDEKLVGGFRYTTCWLKQNDNHIYDFVE